jgi:hypothetical protein
MQKLRIELLKMPEWAQRVIVARVIEMPECLRGKGRLEYFEDSSGRWLLESAQKPELCSRAIYVCGRASLHDNDTMTRLFATTKEAELYRGVMRTLVRKLNERLAAEAGEAVVKPGNSEIIE